MLTYWETLTAIQSNVPVNDSYAQLWGRKSQGGYTVVTYIGTLPAVLAGTKAGYLHRYKIYGNTEQIGTPTPENPIVPSECGERTKQLFDITSSAVTTTSCTMAVNNDVLTQVNTGGNSRTTWKINDLQVDTDYTLSVNFINQNASECQLRIYDSSDNSAIALSSPSRATTGNLLVTFTAATSTHYIRIYSNTSGTANSSTVNFTDIMLNLGSTPLPYIPYGYKLPLTSAGQNVDIYLGESQTTRRIKKLVLTGEEYWTKFESTGAVTFYIKVPDGTSDIVLSTHFSAIRYGGLPLNNGVLYNGTTNKNMLFRMGDDTTITDVTSFKSFLAAQYAAGTPVTVWYVLAEPETGIVNEPLMKIGDYADIIDSSLNSAQIPTSANSTTISWAGEGLAPSQVELEYEKKR